MTIRFVAVGKPKSEWARAAWDHHCRFLRKYVSVECDWIKRVASSGRNPAAIKRMEGDQISELLTRHNGAIIACDRVGKTFDSKTFSTEWRRWLDQHGGHASVVIGGAWGLDERVLARSDTVWSFGPMTVSHELALIIAVEQIARAHSILHGDAYHK